MSIKGDDNCYRAAAYHFREPTEVDLIQVSAGEWRLIVDGVVVVLTSTLNTASIATRMTAMPPIETPARRTRKRKTANA